MSLCHGRCALAGAELPTPGLQPDLSPTPAGKEAAPTAEEQVSRIRSKSRVSHSSCLSAVLQGKMRSLFSFLVTVLQNHQF